MRFEEQKQKIDQLLKRIQHANTGSPAELANSFRVSTRTIRRWIEYLNEKGHSIYFCRKSNSYLDDKEY